MTTFYVHKNAPYGALPLLEAADAPSAEAIRRLPDNVDLRCTVTQSRDGGRHRFYWAMLGKIHANLPEGVNLDREALHELVKLGAGCKHVVKLPGDTFYEVPASISFSKMDEMQFRAFMENAIKFICSDLVPELDSEVLTNEVYDFLGGGS